MHRLSPLDASFLYMESPQAHMHVGALAIHDDPGLSQDGLRGHVQARLHHVPRFRQKLVWVPGHVGRPCWADDPDFQIARHVHLAGAPLRGERPLLAWASRLLSQPLDRRHPLWELWAAHTHDGRLALLCKMHHCLVDGVGALELGAAIMDLSPEAVAEEAPPWAPVPPAGPLRRFADALSEHVHRSVSLLAAARRLGRSPHALGRWGKNVVQVATDWGRGCLGWAPRTSFNRPIGPRRRFAVVRSDLPDVERIKEHFDCTINDVVLAAVAGGVRHLMRSRGEPVDDGGMLRAMVPVNRRTSASPGSYGNQVSWVVAGLPVGIGAPEARLRSVQGSMGEVKRSKQSSGAELLFQAAEHVAPPGLALTCRLVSRFQRTVNLIVTNVPGPQAPLYLAGGELREAFPVVPIVGATSLGIAILSYNGRLCFGLQGDADVFGEDLDLLGEGIGASLAELRSLVPGRQAPRNAPQESRVSPDTQLTP